LDVPTRSSKPAPNGRARASLLLGLVAVALIPAAVGATRYFEEMDLLDAWAAVPAAALLAVGAIVLARRARQQIVRTLGRIGGARVATLGRSLGVLGLCVAATAGIALGFYGLLTLFAT
jgi:hypothetical protein